MDRIGKRALLALFILLVLVAPSLAGQANVFVYHRFGDARHPSTNISMEAFAAQLKHLARQNYSVLTLGEIVRRLRTGEPLPERCAALTVDDAYTSFLTGAMPLLRRYGYPATLFVSSDLVGAGGYLGWEELRKLQDEGIEIGNHSASHDYLLDRTEGESVEKWRNRVEKDIRRAQRALERELGRAPALFAYPYGEYAPDLVDVIRKIGFAGAAAQQSGVIAPAGDLFTLPRFPMGGPYATLEEFQEKLRMRPLPARVLHPDTPVLDENPPALIVQIAPEGLDLDRLRCFVPGQAGATIEPLPGNEGRYRIRATEPLAGRRSKYTLTAPGREGGWFWFSQPWVSPKGWP